MDNSLSVTDRLVMTRSVEHLRLGTSHPRPVEVVRLGGEIDVVTAPAFRECLASDEGRDMGTDLVVDFAEVGFIGAAGINVLFDEARRRGDRGRRVLMRNQPTVLRRVLALLDAPSALVSLDEPRADGDRAPST